MKADVDKIFLCVALAYLVGGMSLGIGMGVAEDFSYAHLHAHINLAGFVAHGFFGVIHRLWPGLRESALTTPQLYTMLVGTPIFLVGLPLAQFQGQPLFAIIGSLLVLASTVMFLIMFGGKTLRQPQTA